MNQRISSLVNLFPTPMWNGTVEGYLELNKILHEYINN